jgi:hypothetical protein
VDSRVGLDDAEKRKFLTLPGIELRPLCRPAHSQSLCRLRYPGYINEDIKRILTSGNDCYSTVQKYDTGFGFVWAWTLVSH